MAIIMTLKSKIRSNIPAVIPAKDAVEKRSIIFF